MSDGKAHAHGCTCDGCNPGYCTLLCPRCNGYAISVDCAREREHDRRLVEALATGGWVEAIS